MYVVYILKKYRYYVIRIILCHCVDIEQLKVLIMEYIAYHLLLISSISFCNQSIVSSVVVVEINSIFTQ